eukprot:CAMPEP_0184348302 /NCGR_PEP_ID=MMETSP1089-20130417/27557_1 /TAXON_ID=38269 ORGANISM="Gloeochaete wittrockiana, Strain SAG46.84" /NCGR_SAMPLE_ID=MMETSP1089 /ASSEMBLY_ACC=CAM_ASM_000445 /LENGTH=338 /DNA_ID=CAMNT_0026679957 /DNA_START=280 /DNA_END=1292 /DNA_ORIENTATION=+
MAISKLSSIPIIDISAFWKEDATAAEKGAVASTIRDACENVGFLVVKGHPVPSEVIRTALHAAHELYKLPLDRKLEYMADREVAIYTGYVGGKGCPKYKDGPVKGSVEDQSQDSNGPRGQQAVSKDGDLRETYRINRYPRGLENNVFPSEKDVPGFKQALTTYYQNMEKFGQIMLRMIALSLGLSEEYFLPMFANHSSNLMSAKYFKTEDDGGAKRKGAHTDAGIFTILLQDDTEGYCAGGLQVQTVNSEWVDVPVIPGTYVINIGDTMMRWTNDMFLSSMHQVVNSNMHADRHSLIFFQQANPDTVIKCLEPCRGASGPKYPPIVSQKYFDDKMTRT